jgi:hypothetical protein
MSIRYFIYAVFGFTLISCGKKDTVIVDQPKPSVQCNAQYREASDGLGKMFQFDSHFVRCYGRVGVSKASCIWRQ